MALAHLWTFDRIRRQVMLMTGNRLDAVRATEFINLVLSRLWHDHSWSVKKGETTLTLVAPKAGGTLALNVDRTKVDGTGTNFVSGDVGSFVRISNELSFFQVTAIDVGLQRLTLETAYPGTPTFTGQSYNLFRHIYTLPSDFQEFVSPSYWDQLARVTQQRLDQIDAQRRTSGATPEAYAMRGLNSASLPEVEIWPVPTVATLIRYSYLKGLAPYTPLDGALVVPLRGDLMAYSAAADGLLALALETEHASIAPVLMRQAELRAGQAAGILDEALRQDSRVFGLPESVPVYRGGVTHDANYLATHDDSPIGA